MIEAKETAGQVITAAQDLRERWLPTGAAVRHARALLDAEPQADMAVIPMIQPGKTRGFWSLGQEVVTVPGAVFLAVNSFEVEVGSEVPSYACARNWAAEFARVALGERPGTTAHAIVERDSDNVAVFENY